MPRQRTAEAIRAKQEFDRICKKDKADMVERDAAIVSKINQGNSLAALGREYGLSRERVRQICVKAVTD